MNLDDIHQCIEYIGDKQSQSMLIFKSDNPSIIIDESRYNFMHRLENKHIIIISR